jgi:hypothetical protein
MNIPQFTKLLTDAGGFLFAEETINTNNAWGFGGGLYVRVSARVGGVCYFFDKGHAHFRHLAPEPLERVWVDAPKVGKPFSPKFFEREFRAGVRTREDLLARLPEGA